VQHSPWCKLEYLLMDLFSFELNTLNIQQAFLACVWEEVVQSAFELDYVCWDATSSYAGERSTFR